MTGDEQTSPSYENGTVRDEANVNAAVVREEPPKAKAAKADKAADDAAKVDG